jgi:NitT/TauT family transport system substrate-binding protein
MMRALLTALAVLVTACGAASAPVKTTPGAPVKLTVSYSEIYEGEIPLWVTYEAGIFKKNRLEVDLQYIASSESIAALVSGSVQFSQGGGSEAVSAVVNGADLVLIGNLVPVYPYVFEVPNSIKSINDLKGKKVGVSKPGSSSDIATRIGLKAQGLDPDKDVTIIPVGSSQNRTAALKSGQIQGGLDQLPYSLVLEAQGFHPLFDMAAQKLPTVNNGIVVQRSYMTANKDVTQRYIDSIVEGSLRMRKDKAFTIDVMKNYLKGVDPDYLSKTYDYAMQNLFVAYPYIKPEMSADAITVLAKKDPKVKDFDVNKMQDNSFVKSAADRKLGG